MKQWLGLLFFLVWPLFFPSPAWGQFISCQAGQYIFNSSKSNLEIYSPNFSSNGIFISVAKREKLTIKFRSQKFKKLRLARIRLFYPNGGLYKTSQLVADKPEQKSTYVYKAEMNMDKDFNYLILEIEIWPVSRRARRQGIFYFQTLVVNQNRSEPIFLNLNHPCFQPGQKLELEWKNSQLLDKIKLSLSDEFKKRQKIKEFKYEFEPKTKKSRLAFNLPKLAVDNWYNLQIDLAGPGAKRILVLPIFINGFQPKLDIQEPSDGDAINDQTLAVSGRIGSGVPGRLEAWYQKEGVDKWQPIKVNYHQDNQQYQGKLFDWPIKSLANGIYKLKARWLDWSQQETEVIIQDLKRSVPHGFLGLKVVKRVNLPPIVVSTSDQINKGWLADPKTGQAIIVADSRSSCPGWTLTARFSRLYSPQADHFIEVDDHLKIWPAELSVISGSGDGLHPGFEQTVISPEASLIIGQADSGHGCGVYSQNLLLEWQIPANTPAGDYQGKIVFTIQ